MQLYVGTSGYSYKEWKGNFYPADLSDKEMLHFYGTRLATVEINNTFYRLPKEGVLKTWTEQVPPGFQFAVKASQRITHIKRLKDAGDETEYLLRILRVMDARLGCILFQLPPNFKKDLPRLEQFLKQIPGETRAAFEFRHASWFDDEVFGCLKAHGCALCIADADDDLEIPFVSTANWGYLRLRREAYSGADLKKWMTNVQNQEWEKAFVFFKHEDAGTGPKLAAQFIKLANGAPPGVKKTSRRKN